MFDPKQMNKNNPGKFTKLFCICLCKSHNISDKTLFTFHYGGFTQAAIEARATATGLEATGLQGCTVTSRLSHLLRQQRLSSLTFPSQHRRQEEEEEIRVEILMEGIYDWPDLVSVIKTISSPLL